MFPEVDACVVDIAGKEGKGVIVSDYIVITAAHCLEYEKHTPSITQYALITIGDEMLDMEIRAIDPIADIAALTRSTESFNHFTEYCDNLSPVNIDFLTSQLPEDRSKIFNVDLAHCDPVPVWVRSHEDQWIEGEINLTKKLPHQPNHPTALVKTKAPILGGSSGGPVLNKKGELLGIVSQSTRHSSEPSALNDLYLPNTDGGGTEVTITFPSQSLPKWLHEQLQRNQST